MEASEPGRDMKLTNSETILRGASRWDWRRGNLKLPGQPFDRLLGTQGWESCIAWAECHVCFPPSSAPPQETGQHAVTFLGPALAVPSPGTQLFVASSL